MSQSGYLGIDPGTRALGWALAGLGTLPRLEYAGCSIESACGLEGIARMHVRQIHKHGLGPLCAKHGGGSRCGPPVYLESMTIQRGRETTPQDLIDVQTVGCLTAAALGDVLLFTPAEWKGSTPKEIHHKRMVSADGPLDESERIVLRDALERTPAKHHKEVLDAVGILLYGLGRIERSGKKRGEK